MSAPRADALTQVLLDFAGKSTESLERFAAAHPPDRHLIADLCDFAASDDRQVQAAATWLLKRYSEAGAALSPQQSETLLRLLLADASWLSQLHVLQMMEKLVLPASLAPPLIAALAALASGSNTFIRAWSVHAAAVLADQQPSYRGTVLGLIGTAQQDAAPSVRARLRRTSQAFDWI